MLRNRTIIANFQSDQSTYTLTVNVEPPGVGYVSKNPDKASYSSGETVQLTAYSNSIQGSSDKIFVEAEAGTLSGAMQVGNDSQASGGQYVFNASSVPKSGSSNYSFEVKEAGTYAVWGRCYALSGIEDSFFFVLDGSSDTLTWHLASSYGSWIWQKVSHDFSIQQFNLSEGVHTFSIVARDINTRIDKIIFSKDPDFVPSGKEDQSSMGVYVFDRWGGDLSGTSNPANLTMNANKQVTAYFVESIETVSTPSKPTGPSSGTVGQNLSFSTGGAVSSLGNPVDYQFDFGNGVQSDWGGSTRTNTYQQEGSFEVRARARSRVTPQVISAWSSSHTVAINEPVPNTLSVNVVPAGAGIVDREPYKSGYQQNEWVTLTAIPQTSDNNIRIEAESGELYGSATIGYDEEASGGRYIFGSSSVPKSGRIEYNFEIQQAGAYYIWGRCFSLSNIEDSFFIVVDGSNDTLTWHLDQDFNVWKWQKVSDWYQVKSFQFNSGWHSLTVIIRDINARLDNILITSDPDYIPVGKEERDKHICFEAETGILEGPMSIGNDSNASGGQYIYSTSSNSMAGRANYTFTVQTAGTYYIWGRCYALSGIEDSFFIQVDGSTDVLTWHLASQYHQWIWQKVSHNFVEKSFNFSQGQHTLSVISREINARLDKVFITDDPNYIPSGVEDTPTVRDVAYRFDHWEGDLSGNSNPASLLMNSNKTVTAYFVEAEEFVSSPSSINGPATGVTGQSLTFEAIGASSSKGSDLEYQFDWDNTSTSNWGNKTRDHVFMTSGIKLIKARARSVADTNIVSNWSDPLLVTINGLTLTITVEPDTGGTVAYAPVKAEYSLGDTVTLSANPASGFSFEQWTGSLTGSSNPAQVVMNNNKSVTAVFNRTVETVSKPTYLNGPETGIMGQSLSFSTGGSVSNLGHLLEYQFNWGDGQLSSWGGDTQQYIYSYAGSYQVKSRARCKTHTGVISEWSEPHAITITGYFLMEFISPSGTGTIMRTPNKTFFAVGEKVVLSAAPLPGYKFERWSGDLVSRNNPDTVTMNGNKVITAHFSEASEIVSTPTIISGPDSSIIEQEVTFITGGSTSSKGNPIEYQFHWGDGTLSSWGDSVRTHVYNSAGTNEVKTRARSKSDSSVVSNWAEPHNLIVLSNYFTITISVIPTGAGSVNRTPFKSDYKNGEIVILSPLPTNGYLFDSWGGDLSGIDNPAIITIDGNKNIIAHFKQYSGIDKERDKLPEKFALDQNYPNPFNPETTINYQLAEEGHVKISVYNVHGQVVSLLVDQYQSIGYYSIVWTALDRSGNMLPSGVYLYQIETEHFTQLKKMILIK